MGLLREVFVASQFAKAGGDEARLKELKEQELKYMAYQQRQDEAIDAFFSKIASFFK